jgi:tetratricopeptide (TPR) repeat protein
MRVPPLLSLLLLLPVGAQAVECGLKAFDPSVLKPVCPDVKACQAYQDSVMEQCVRTLIGTNAAVDRLKDKTDRTPEEDQELALQSERASTIYDEMSHLAALADKDDFKEKYRDVPAFKAVQRGEAPLAQVIPQRIMSSLFPGISAEPLPPGLFATSAPQNYPKLAPQTVDGLVDLSLKNKEGPAKVQEAGEKSLASGQTEQAELFAQALIDKAPKDPHGPSLMAEAALKSNRPADAERWAQKALALDPRDKKASDALQFARSELSAQKLKKPVVGSFQEARAQDLDRGIAGAMVPPRPAGPGGAPDAKAAAKAADPVPRVLGGLLRRGYEKMRLDDLPGALGDVSVHLDAHPEDTEARLIRAEVLLKLGKPAPALADIDAALAKSPDDPRALRARAAALYEIGGRDGEALRTIERALEIEPASGIGHLTRAKILERLDRIPEAIAEYRTAAQLDPTLEPITEAALRRLGAAPGPSKAVEKGLLRGGFLVVSLGLILFGLVGGAVVVTRRARTAEAAAALAAALERTLKPGDLVAGQYRIARELGRGGMGVVFEAVDEKLKRSVALKQLQGDYRASAEDAARFLQEARLVAQLRHPNVAEIYAAVEDGGLYLVFELVRGRSLDALLGSGVTPEQARGIVAHACAALTAAHARRIVHRDLKPSNMMITEDGQLKVMDFGIAHQSLSGGAFTQTSASGTPPYMAPEQAMGSVSSASDLYALGVMAYELLAGARPFAGPDFLGPKMRGEFAPVTSRRAGLPARLDAFFASALSPDPTRRPKDAAAFASAFAACWS